MNKTVVIPAAGLGSRLGEFTKNYSKAMCTLGEKPVFAHIIDNFNIDDNIIIILGYKGELLREVVETYYPERKITFVTVDDYDGPKSGLGYSLSFAREYLQKPFIFWSCDTVLKKNVVNELVSGHTNKMVVCEMSEQYSDTYRHIKYDTNTNKVTEILPKNPYYNQNIFAYTGVSYIYDWEVFWNAVDNDFETFRKDGETYCLNALSNIDVILLELKDWIDTGNRKIFENAKKEYSDNMDAVILEKPSEAIWFNGDKVIKFHIDEKFISDRCKRYKTIMSKKHESAKKIDFPRILAQTKHTYTYEYRNGNIASSIINEKIFEDIINSWFNDAELLDLNEIECVKIYNDFYKDKTLKRIKEYCNLYTDIDSECYINGVKCKPAYDLVKNIDWSKLALDGLFTENYHGDFHLENILVDNNKYIMLDWRQNFGKSMAGDLYYDIAKMWHSLIVNHKMVKDELFVVNNTNKDNIVIDIHRTLIDTDCEYVLKNWIREHYKDKGLLHAELLTAIIFLNCAACHTYPYSRFLFNLGKLMINKFYNKHKKEFWNE